MQTLDPCCFGLTRGYMWEDREVKRKRAIQVDSLVLDVSSLPRNGEEGMSFTKALPGTLELKERNQATDVCQGSALQVFFQGLAISNAFSTLAHHKQKPPCNT